MKCTYCKTRIRKDAQFCQFCGTSMGGAELVDHLGISIGNASETMISKYKNIMKTMKYKDVFVMPSNDKIEFLQLPTIMNGGMDADGDMTARGDFIATILDGIEKVEKVKDEVKSNYLPPMGS